MCKRELNINNLYLMYTHPSQPLDVTDIEEYQQENYITVYGEKVTDIHHHVKKMIEYKMPHIYEKILKSYMIYPIEKIIEALLLVLNTTNEQIDNLFFEALYDIYKPRESYGYEIYNTLSFLEHPSDKIIVKKLLESIFTQKYISRFSVLHDWTSIKLLELCLNFEYIEGLNMAFDISVKSPNFLSIISFNIKNRKLSSEIKQCIANNLDIDKHRTKNDSKDVLYVLYNLQRDVIIDLNNRVKDLQKIKSMELGNIFTFMVGKYL